MADSLAQTQVQTCATGCKIKEVLRADLTEMSLAHSKQSFRVCVHSFSVRLPKMTEFLSATIQDLNQAQIQ